MLDENSVLNFMLEEESVIDFMLERKSVLDFKLEEESIPDFMLEEDSVPDFMIEKESVPDFMHETQVRSRFCVSKESLPPHLCLKRIPFPILYLNRKSISDFIVKVRPDYVFD